MSFSTESGNQLAAEVPSPRPFLLQSPPNQDTERKLAGKFMNLATDAGKAINLAPKKKSIINQCQKNKLR